MKRLALYAVAGGLALLLAACAGLGAAPEPHYTLDGEWLLSQRVVESSRADFELGDVFDTRVGYTTSDGTVTETGPSGVRASGVRSGNRVTTVREGQSGNLGFDITHDVVLTSDVRLEGTARHRYFDGTRVILEVSGERVAR